MAEASCRCSFLRIPLQATGHNLDLIHPMWALLKEFYRFSKQEKKLWLVPLIILLVLLGAILVFTANSGITWALYPFL